MKDSDKKILLVLLAIGLLVASFMLVFKPQKEQVDAIEAENSQLQVRLNDLIEKEAHKDELLAEIEQYKKDFAAELVNYPADLNQETTVMFMKGVEQALDFVNNSFSMPRETAFYTITSDVPSGDGLETESASVAQDPYVATKTAYGVSYKGSYEGLKNYLKYIADYKYRMAVSSVSIAYNQNAEQPIDECAGTILLEAFAVDGPDRVADTVNVSVEEGVDNIFLGKGVPSSMVATSYDSNNGQDIVASHSLVVLLNNAGNDAGSGIIVASDENAEATYVTSNDNAETELNVSVYSQDGKNFVKYEIGGKEYSAEVLSADVTIYVKSSARVNADDKNAVKLNVSNTAGIGVYVKVADDDAASPRFSLGTTSGVVKVY